MTTKSEVSSFGVPGGESPSELAYRRLVESEAEFQRDFDACVNSCQKVTAWWFEEEGQEALLRTLGKNSAERAGRDLAPHVAVARIEKFKNEISLLQKRVGVVLGHLQDEIETSGKAFAETQRVAREEERRQRMASRPEPKEVEMGRKCSQCHKKPARVDDLCKVCARAAGIIVKGKI